MPNREANDIRESAGQGVEKAVVHVKSVCEIPDGYDAAGSGVQYIVDGPQSPQIAGAYGSRKEPAKDLAFKAQEEDFVREWPAVMHIENADYKCTLFYAGAVSDPHSDVGEYAADRAAGRLSRKYLTLRCKPKDPEREADLTIMAGHVAVKLRFVMQNLMIKEARRLVEDLQAAISSAGALDDFITARFGPAEE